MPNHVFTEMRFSGLSKDDQLLVAQKCTNPIGEIDFETILPIPLNLWMHSTGRKHTDTFPGSALDWCKANWSTKWNAYGPRTVTQDPGGDVILQFKTAWSPPYGWMVAVFNSLHFSFTYTSLNQGENQAVHGYFNHAATLMLMSEPWVETSASQEETVRLMKLLWGNDAAIEIMAERSAE